MPRQVQALFLLALPKLELGEGAARAVAGALQAVDLRVLVGELPVEQALLLIDADQPALAQLSIDRYLVRHPDSARAHFVAGEAWRARSGESGAIDQAIAAYARAIELPGTGN